jgi:hypothetical protein
LSAAGAKPWRRPRREPAPGEACTAGAERRP